MKRILFFMAFVFTVVCYAAPPPDLVQDMVTVHSGYVVQDNSDVTVYPFKVQEVAFVYLGNFEFSSYQEYLIEPVAKLEFPELVMNDYFYAFADDRNKPPSIQALNGRIINMQNSNYGYPFTGN